MKFCPQQYFRKLEVRCAGTLTLRHENPVLSENEDSDEKQMLDDDEDELFSDDRSLDCASSSTSVVSMHSKLQWTVTVGFFTSASRNLVWKSFKNVVDCIDLFQLQLIRVFFLALRTTLPTWTHQTFVISRT